MKKYYNKETTPLTYHKLLWYVGLPLTVISNISGIISNHSIITTYSYSKYTSYVAIESILAIISVVIAIITFIGFCKWAKYGWYGILFVRGLNSFYSLILIAIYSDLAPDSVGVALGRFIASIAWFIVTLIYYLKRKPLFFGGGMVGEGNKVTDNDEYTMQLISPKLQSGDLKTGRVVRIPGTNYSFKAPENKQQVIDHISTFSGYDEELTAYLDYSVINGLISQEYSKALEKECRKAAKQQRPFVAPEDSNDSIEVGVTTDDTSVSVSDNNIESIIENDVQEANMEETKDAAVLAKELPINIAGTKLPESSSDDDGLKILFCRKCGKQIPTDSEFCNYCGEKVIKL